MELHSNRREDDCVPLHSLLWRGQIRPPDEIEQSKGLGHSRCWLQSAERRQRRSVGRQRARSAAAEATSFLKFLLVGIIHPDDDGGRPVVSTRRIRVAVSLGCGIGTLCHRGQGFLDGPGQPGHPQGCIPAGQLEQGQEYRFLPRRWNGSVDGDGCADSRRSEARQVGRGAFAGFRAVRQRRTGQDLQRRQAGSRFGRIGYGLPDRSQGKVRHPRIGRQRSVQRLPAGSWTPSARALHPEMGPGCRQGYRSGNDDAGDARDTFRAVRPHGQSRLGVRLSGAAGAAIRPAVQGHRASAGGGQSRSQHPHHLGRRKAGVRAGGGRREDEVAVQEGRQFGPDRGLERGQEATRQDRSLRQEPPRAGRCGSELDGLRARPIRPQSHSLRAGPGQRAGIRARNRRNDREGHQVLAEELGRVLPAGGRRKDRPRPSPEPSAQGPGRSCGHGFGGPDGPEVDRRSRHAHRGDSGPFAHLQHQRISGERQQNHRIGRRQRGGPKRLQLHDAQLLDWARILEQRQQFHAGFQPTLERRGHLGHPFEGVQTTGPHADRRRRPRWRRRGRLR